MRGKMLRRKWFRRGKACAEFTLAIFIVLIEALVLAVCRIFGSIARLVRAAFQGRARGGAAGDSGRIREHDGAELVLQPVTASEVPNTDFGDVAGLHDAKQEIMVRTLLPLQHRDRAAAYQLVTGGGLLLWGPPGCGKTLLARAVAGELRCPFFQVRPSDVMNQWVGQSEKNIASLFKRARSLDRAVVFLDEIDALCPSRRRNHSTIMQRVISEILSQMDGLDTQCDRHSRDGYLLFIGATNWPEALDEALLRPGRFDVRVFVDLPDVSARRQIIAHCLGDCPVEHDETIVDLVSDMEGLSGADIVQVVKTAARAAFLDALQSDVDSVPISRQHFDDTVRKVSPSVSPSELARYRGLAIATRARL